MLKSDIKTKLDKLDDFICNEYSIYRSTTDDPIKYDDWLAGNDCVAIVEANKEYEKLYDEFKDEQDER